MPLTVSRTDSKEHLYFRLVGANGSRKVYLGSPEKPKRENIEQAIEYLDNKIKRYETERFKLWNLINKQGEAKYKLAVFDLDGVIFDAPWRDMTNHRVAVSTWDILFQELGMYNVHERMRKLYEENIFKTYREWTEEACKFLSSAKLERKIFDEVIKRRPLVEGAAEVLQKLSRSGVIIAVITGSFDELAQRIRKEIAPIDYIFAHCRLVFSKQGYLTDWNLKDCDYADKARIVENISKKHKIPKAQRIYVGDDVNDVEAFKKVGLSIAFNCGKPAARQAADVVIESRNLQSILPHLFGSKNDGFLHESNQSGTMANR